MTPADIRHLVLGPGPLEYVDRPAVRGAEALAPLVFLHEGLGSLGLWRGFPAAVRAATGRRTVVWSRHGYGGSAVLRERRRPDYMHREAREILPAFLAALGLERPVLVGHSDGASIALIHAGTPELPPVDALVLLAPHVVVEDRSIEGIEQARRTYLETDLAARLGRYHTDPETTFWGWNDIWLDPAFRDWDITDVLPDVSAPLLLVQGVDDEYGTLRQLDLVEERVRGPVTRVHLEACGHAPHLQQRDRTLAVLTAFLSRRGG